MSKKNLSNSVEDMLSSETILDESLEPLEEKQYGFKVFKRQGNGLLHSASVPNGSKLHKTYRENYKTNVTEEMFAAGFGLCCFLNLAEARQFDGNNDGEREVWKIEIGEVKEPASCRPSIRVLEELLPAEKMKKTNYHRILSIVKKGATRDEWPKGTKVTSFVIPIERIE